jgi:hypothetical protein
MPPVKKLGREAAVPQRRPTLFGSPAHGMYGWQENLQRIFYPREVVVRNPRDVE